MNSCSYTRTKRISFLSMKDIWNISLSNLRNLSCPGTLLIQSKLLLEYCQLNRTGGMKLGAKASTKAKIGSLRGMHPLTSFHRHWQMESRRTAPSAFGLLRIEGVGVKDGAAASATGHATCKLPRA